MKVVLETKRLILRETSMDDFDHLYQILSDAETMKHYPKPYEKDQVERWILWCQSSYKENGFGLWAVILKETMEYIGDCGCSIQNIDGKLLPEIGYHIHKNHQHKGYATEAAKAVKDYIFATTDYNEIYTYMKYTNVNSYSTAIKNDMSLYHEYKDPKNEISRAFSITRETYMAYKNANSSMEVRKAMPKDIEDWMLFVESIQEYFPKLKTKEQLQEYKKTVLRFMDSGRAVLAKVKGQLAGLMLYSKKSNRICFLVVKEEYQRTGVASNLMKVVLPDLDSSRVISVNSFVESSEYSKAAKPFYESFGFIPDIIGVNHGEPFQRYIKKPRW